MELIGAFVDMANSAGEDLNDGEDWPGWMTAGFQDGVLEITYEDTDHLKMVRRYQVTPVYEMEPVFRVLDQDGAPVDSRVWSRSGPAKLALRHGGRSDRVQSGKVIWV